MNRRDEDDGVGYIPTEIVLSPEEWDRFQDMINNPAPPSEALRKLLERTTDKK